MKKEKLKVDVSVQASDDALMSALETLKPGEALRIETAAEAYRLPRVRATLNCKIQCKSKIDGDDLLVWVWKDNRNRTSKEP